MAAQDLIISRRGPMGASSLDSEADSGGADGASILFGALRKRWLLLGIVGLAALALAVVAGYQFGSQTAVIKSSLIYTGLPGGATTNAYDPLGAATGSEMILDVRILGQLCEKRGLDMSPTSLASQVTTSNGRSSSLLNLTLAWDDVEEGIGTLNDLMAIFIEEMATKRKAILKDHLDHMRLSLMRADESVTTAKQALDALEKAQEQQLSQGGAANDQYRNSLTSFESAKSQLASKLTEQLSQQQLLERVTAQIAEIVKEQQDVEHSVKTEYLGAVEAVVKTAGKDLAPNNPAGKLVEQTIAKIRGYVNAKDAPSDIDRWRKGLADILGTESSGLSNDKLQKLNDEFIAIARTNETKLSDVGSRRRELERSREQMQQALIPLKNQVAALGKSCEELERKSQQLSEKITGISATQVDEADRTLSEAEETRNTLKSQRDSLEQLSNSRLREWTVNTPASTATTQLDSNHMKLFVLVFAFFGLLFSAPIFAAEWHAQMGSPQIQLARSLRVPVLAERVLEHFSPKQRKKGGADLPSDNLESIRMLTLKIQQSCHQPGSVVLFSSLDPSVSVSPLMATVAECLAEREERVLLVDAVSPDRALAPVTNLLPVDKGAKASDVAEEISDQAEHHELVTKLNGHEHRNGSPKGLSDYLCEGCDAVGELIRPTGSPGVDLISSGRTVFPREAMASSGLTELLNTCRRNYTMVLIHGPAADCAADLQMLTARADGVILVATKASSKDNRVREVVQDLLELGAPVIGLVA